MACRDDLDLRVFFTWHAGDAPTFDRGFRERFAWDIALTEGYGFERVPNTAADPGTHHFFGLRNPSLVDRVAAWAPDAVVVHGWAWLSHLQALRAFRRLGIPTLFRGDSHLLDNARHGPRWLLKRWLLSHVFAWPTGFLVVGSANRAYYEAFGVAPERLHQCPHTIDVGRFANSADALELEALRWRQQLNIPEDRTVLLYAGKFEPKKCPVELMRLVLRRRDWDLVLVMVGGGELQSGVDTIAAADPARFRVLPFQNQSRMPVVYRLGELFVLPSSYGESWGLAVNEAMACGRPVLVSDRVGCAADVVDADCGRIFPWRDLNALEQAIDEFVATPGRLVKMRHAAVTRSLLFDIPVAEQGITAAMAAIDGAQTLLFGDERRAAE